MTNSQKLDLLLNEMHGMRKEFGERFERVDERLDKVETHLARVDERLDKVDSRLDRLESNTSSLKEGQLRQGRLLKYLTARLEETYQLALDAWGQSTENRKMITASV